MSEQQTEIRIFSAAETIDLAFKRAKAASEAKADKHWRKAYAYYLSSVRLFMKTLPAYQSKGKKKEKALITKQITVMMDEAAAVKKEAEATFDITTSESVLTGLDEEWFADDECKIAPALFSHNREEFEANGNMHTRDRVVLEIFSTEQTYLANIKSLYEDFLVPLERAKEVSFIGRTYSVLSKKDRGVLQSIRIEPMIRLHEKLLLEIEGRVHNWSPTQMIGDIFQRYSPFFKCYVEYASRFDELSKTIQDLKTNNKRVQKIFSRRDTDMESLMICPIQRIPRYKLLLQELLKTTDRKHPDGDHRDCESIPLALEQISRTATFVNASIDEYQQRHKLLVLQKTLWPKQDLAEPGRQIVKTGDLVRIEIGQSTDEVRPVKARLFLLSDILIRTVPTRYKFSSIRTNKTYNRCISPNVKPARVEIVPSDFLMSRLAWPVWQQILPLLAKGQSLADLTRKVKGRQASGTAVGLDYRQSGGDLCIHTWMDGLYTGGWKEGVGPHGFGRWKREFKVAASPHSGDAETAAPHKKYDSYVGGWIEGQMDTRSLPGVPHQPAVYIKHHQDPTTGRVVTVKRVGEWRDSKMLNTPVTAETPMVSGSDSDTTIDESGGSDGAAAAAKSPESSKKASQSSKKVPRPSKKGPAPEPAPRGIKVPAVTDDSGPNPMTRVSSLDLVNTPGVSRQVAHANTPVEQELDDLENLLFESDEEAMDRAKAVPTVTNSSGGGGGGAPAATNSSSGGGEAGSRPGEWGCAEVGAFVQTLGAGDVWTQCATIMLANQIDGATLLAAEIGDLTDLGIAKIHSRRILQAIHDRQPQQQQQVQHKPAARLLDRCAELCQTDRQAAASIKSMQERLVTEFGAAAFAQHRAGVISLLRSHVLKRQRSSSSVSQTGTEATESADERDKTNPTTETAHASTGSSEEAGARLSASVFFAVARGEIPGIYMTKADCEKQVSGFKDGLFKECDSFQAARDFVVSNGVDLESSKLPLSPRPPEELIYAFEVLPLKNSDNSSVPTKRSIYLCKSAEERDAWMKEMQTMIQNRIRRNKDFFRRRATISHEDMHELKKFTDLSELMGNGSPT